MSSERQVSGTAGQRTIAVLGSAIFFVVAPCTLAGFVPWSITGWQLQPPFLGLELTRGVGADKAIITVDIVNEHVVAAAVEAIRKGGTAVITGLADPYKVTVQLSGAVMTLYEKTVKGSLFGSGNPVHDIPKLLGMYQGGKLKLDELVTKRYTLDQINEGYADLLDGKNIRGVIVHEH